MAVLGSKIWIHLLRFPLHSRKPSYNFISLFSLHYSLFSIWLYLKQYGKNRITFFKKLVSTSALHKVQNKASSSPDCCCGMISSLLRQSSLTRKPQKKHPTFEHQFELCRSDIPSPFSILLGSAIGDANPK